MVGEDKVLSNYGNIIYMYLVKSEPSPAAKELMSDYPGADAAKPLFVSDGTLAIGKKTSLCPVSDGRGTAAKPEVGDEA